jgi:hypothetical protein
VGFDLATPRAERLLAEEKLAGWVRRVASGAAGTGVVMVSLGLLLCGVPAVSEARDGRFVAFVGEISEPGTLAPFLLYWVTGLGLTVGGARLHELREWARRLLAWLTSILCWAWLAATLALLVRAAWLVLPVRTRALAANYDDAALALGGAMVPAAFTLYLRWLRGAVTSRVAVAACAPSPALSWVARDRLLWRDSLLHREDDAPKQGAYGKPLAWLWRLLTYAFFGAAWAWFLSLVVGDLRRGSLGVWDLWLILPALYVTAAHLPRGLVDGLVWDEGGLRLRLRLGNTVRLPWDSLDEAQVAYPIGEHERAGDLHLFAKGRPRPYVIPVSWDRAIDLLGALSTHIRVHDMRPINKRRTPQW